MIEVYNRDRRRVAILQNAFDVSESRKINALWYLTFSLPAGDPKNAYCNAFWYVRDTDSRDSPLYRIMPRDRQRGETSVNTYECEHVLATLMDDILYSYHVPNEANTRGYLTYILDRQTVKNWVLGDVEFTRRFEYAWENENLLAALFSIAAPLDGYIWETDTSVYPWKVSLRQLDTQGIPELYVRAGHNMLSYGDSSSPTQICTRLYPLGYGEGVNQLTIAGVNGGLPYIQSPQSYIDKYGLISRVWTDRRYENPESLLAAAQSMLAELQEPLVQYECGLAEIKGEAQARIGQRVRIITDEDEIIDTYITELTIERGECDMVTVGLANKSTDIASTVADMADRQRIESTYAQGATQLYSLALQGNASSAEGLELNFYLPSDLRIINKIIAKVQMSSFRAYSSATKTTNTVTATSTDGGGDTYTSSSGGGSETTTKSGGGSTVTSEGGGGSAETTHGSSNVEWTYGSTTTVSGHSHEIRMVSYHEHEVEFPEHEHDVDIPSHRHTVNIPDHDHRISIPAHSHNVQIPGHAHDITPGIYYFGAPKSFTLYVNGRAKQTFSATGAELDLTSYLTGEDGKIPRGAWHTIEIRPDDLAYISIDMYVQGFVQSRGDQTV